MNPPVACKYHSLYVRLVTSVPRSANGLYIFHFSSNSTYYIFEFTKNLKPPYQYFQKVGWNLHFKYLSYWDLEFDTVFLKYMSYEKP